MNKKAGRRAVIMVFILLVISGCASVDLDMALNDRYNHLLKEVGEDSDMTHATHSKNNHEKDAFEGLDVLKMEMAVKTALRNNPDLSSIRARVREAVERYPQAISLNDPTIALGLYPATIGSNGADFSFKADIVQRFPYPGKLDLKGQIALGEAEAQMGDFKSARLELIRMVKTAYLTLFFIHRAIGINGEEKRILEEYRKAAISMYAVGKGGLQDPTLSEVELARVEHREIILDRMLKIASARLNTLMGRGTELPLPSPLSILPEVGELPDKPILVKDALSSNPDIKAKRLKREASLASLKLAALSYYPDFTVKGSYNRAWTRDELRPLIGVGINIPLHFGRLDAREREAEAKFIRMDFDLKAAMDRVRYEVEDAYQKLKESFHAAGLYEKTLLPATELNLKAAEIGYREGKNDFLTLLTAERRLIDTRLEYERILVDLHIRKAELERAVGGKL